MTLGPEIRELSPPAGRHRGRRHRRGGHPRRRRFRLPPAVRPPRGARGRAGRPAVHPLPADRRGAGDGARDPGGPGRRTAVVLPGGRAAVLRHVGPFSALRDACERLARWIAEQGEAADGPFWESQVTNPREEPDASKWITDVVQPLV